MPPAAPSTTAAARPTAAAAERPPAAGSASTTKRPSTAGRPSAAERFVTARRSTAPPATGRTGRRCFAGAATRAARHVRPSGVPAAWLDAWQLACTRLDEVGPPPAERVTRARLGGYEARAITRDHIVRVRAARDEHSSEHVRTRPEERVAVAEAISVAARRPSPERVVAEGIVERVAEIAAPVRISEADSEAEMIGVAVAVVVVIVPVSISRCDPGAFDDVRDRVILEMPCAGHALHDVEQSREWIVFDRFVAQDAVVPVPVADELVVLERLCHPGGEHRARAVVVVHHKRIAIRSAPQLLPLPAANEVVVSRIKREQHAHAAIRI